MELDEDKKPFKVKDVTRNIKKAVVASSLEEIRLKVAERFEKDELIPTIHLDSDGTEIDDEEYFRTLEPNAELIAVFPGEHWIDPVRCLTVSRHRKMSDQTDSSCSSSSSESDRLKKIVGQIQNNLCNVSVMSDPDLDSLSNMDPNSLVDITGIEHYKDSAGRALYAERTAKDRIDLLRILKEERIFHSSQYEPSQKEKHNKNEHDNTKENDEKCLKKSNKNKQEKEILNCSAEEAI